jgi:NDP-sugar pyrophosphorylase family protein
METEGKSPDIAQVPAAILAGGLGTRLLPVTTAIPKVLVEVAGRPFIDHQLTLLRRNGVRSVVLCLGHLGAQVREHLEDTPALGIEVQYSFDGPRLLGTGGALRRALPMLGEVFWVLYGDSYLDIDYCAVLADLLRRGAPALMTVLQNNNRWDRSNLFFREGAVVRYSKRNPDPEMTYIDYGVSLLTRDVAERIPPDQPYDLADLYANLASRGQLAGYEVTERFYEIGSPRGLAETEACLSRRNGAAAD